MNQHLSSSPPPAELTIVIPTFNERDNLEELVSEIKKTLSSVLWEVVFVDDDSPDGTALCAQQLANQDSRIRCIRRIGRRGLSSACTEGILSSSAPYVAIMDADLQHDASLLPEMLKTLKEKHLDVVVGSRYVEGRRPDKWDNYRLKMSLFAVFLSQHLLKVKLKDPMSGFFIIKRTTFENAVKNLSGIGFKILLDIFLSSPAPLKFQEIPFSFQNRKHGLSKLDFRTLWDYLMLLGDKWLHKSIPVRFLSFSLIGSLGMILHLMVLTFCLKRLHWEFIQSQVTAVLNSMFINYSLNNFLTYRDCRLKGWQWWKGLLSFFFVCSLGAFANIAASTYLFQQGLFWLLAALIGIAIGAVWNYSLSSFYTWNK